MQQNIFSVAEVEQAIKNGRTLLIAGEEALLAKLPQGKWVGGTIPYFVIPNKGGVVSQEQVFVTDISEVASAVTVAVYDQNTLGKIYTDADGSGFSFIIVPAASLVHASFAVNAPNYKDFGCRPLIGWVSGVHLSDLGKMTPKVFDGTTGKAYEQDAVVMHVMLPASKTVDAGIINLFEQGDGDILTFTADGFTVSEVMVNGVKENFADYITRNNLDTKLPLVADYYGALVNISFQNVEPGGEVKLYAPVFSGIRYKHAKAISNYAEAFSGQLQKSSLEAKSVAFSCNCILNYLYSGLEGKNTDPFVGPVTFGEIAYQLLNQTLIYLEVHDV
ncbi:MAG: hypothetical protein AB7U29_05770 [Desulfobulbus sp.]